MLSLRRDFSVLFREIIIGSDRIEPATCRWWQIFPNFQLGQRWHHITSYDSFLASPFGAKDARYLCSEKWTVCRERELRRKDNVHGQTSERFFFSPQMEAVVFTILQIFFVKRAVSKLKNIYADTLYGIELGSSLWGRTSLLKMIWCTNKWSTHELAFLGHLYCGSFNRNSNKSLLLTMSMVIKLSFSAKVGRKKAPKATTMWQPHQDTTAELANWKTKLKWRKVNNMDESVTDRAWLTSSSSW